MRVSTPEEYEAMFSRFTRTLSPQELDEIRSELDLQAKLSAWMNGNQPTNSQTQAFLGGGGNRLIGDNIESQKREELAKAPPKVTRKMARDAWHKGVASLTPAQRRKNYTHVKGYTTKKGNKVKASWRRKPMARPNSHRQINRRYRVLKARGMLTLISERKQFNKREKQRLMRQLRRVEKEETKLARQEAKYSRIAREKDI